MNRRLSDRVQRSTITCVFVIVIASRVSLASDELADPRTEAVVIEGPVVDEGDNIMLSCAVFNVSGERAKSFRMEWRRDAVVITRGKRVMSPDPRYTTTMIDGVSDRRDFVLHISRVNRNDTGRYVCWVIVRDWYSTIAPKKASSYVDMTVRYFPRNPRCFHDGFSDVFRAGTVIHFLCVVQKGEPTVRTRWMGPNDMVLFANETRRGDYIYNTLTFSAASTHHGMEFTCEVTSEADIFVGVLSSCQVGPIEIIDSSLVINDVDYSSSSSFNNDYSFGNNDAFSERAPIPMTTRRSTERGSTTETPMDQQLLTTPKLGLSQDGVPITNQSTATPLLAGFVLFIILFVVSVILNVCLIYRLRKAKRSQKYSCEDEDNNVVPSICSGVSNEEYMDMHDQGLQQAGAGCGAPRPQQHEGRFYSTIGGNHATTRPTSMPQSSDYDSPRTSMVAVSSSPRRSFHQSSFTHSIYENLGQSAAGGRPVTPPRTKRKSRCIEHAV